MRLFFPRLNDFSSCSLECYTDAAFANLPNDGSQGAMLIFLRDSDGKRCPIFWQTRCLRRTPRSTLEAETLALVEGAEASVYLGNILTQITGRKSITVRCLVDNRSLYDSVYSTRQVDNKKLRMDVKAVKNMLVSGEINGVDWVEAQDHKTLPGGVGGVSNVLWWAMDTRKKILNENVIEGLLDAMIESGKHYSATHHSPLPLMYQYYETEYLGAAHGLAGILQMLLSFPSWLHRRPEASSLIKRSIEVLLSYQTASGNFPCAMDELGGRRHPDEELVHWCHGAPGTVYLLGKAYQVFGGDLHLQSAIKCGEVTWQKGLLKKGPGICHGVAGSGYVFLTLYRLTGNPLHLHRAMQFMSFMFTLEFKSARTPDSPYSLYEGMAGTVCFLTDLMNPEKSEFPFYSIF
ncbi:unnamed protein product, partial [Meganyctiphanes norvegica]